MNWIDRQKFLSLGTRVLISSGKDQPGYVVTVMCDACRGVILVAVIFLIFLFCDGVLGVIRQLIIFRSESHSIMNNALQ